MSIESVMLFNHLIFGCPLLLLLSIFPSIRRLLENDFQPNSQAIQPPVYKFLICLQNVSSLLLGLPRSSYSSSHDHLSYGLLQTLDSSDSQLQAIFYVFYTWAWRDSFVETSYDAISVLHIFQWPLLVCRIWPRSSQWPVTLNDLLIQIFPLHLLFSLISSSISLSLVDSTADTLDSWLFLIYIYQISSGHGVLGLLHMHCNSMHILLNVNRHS